MAPPQSHATGAQAHQPELIRGRLIDQEHGAARELVSNEQRSQNTSPSQKTAMPHWSRKGREKSTIARTCIWIVDHQIGIALNLLSVLSLTHIAFPRARHHTQKFFRISYYNEATGTFALGWDDICFVLYWIIVFTGMRCVVMDYLLTPLAAWAGVEKKKARVRFAEQAWILLYPLALWSCGMYIWYNSAYWLNLRALWQNWPIREMSGLSKWYYLVQFAFWLQQIVVVNIEERRKDHAQMFTHHVITCALIFASYGYHQTKVGNVILCLMDVNDILLPLAKILKYLKFRLACDIAFGVFMVTWLVARHIMYMFVCWSIYAHIPEEINYGCYRGSVEDLKGPLPVPNDFDHLTQPFRDPVGLVCWNNEIKWAFLGMLLALQVVLLVWFTMIMKVAYKVITGQGADDTRSDDEDEEDEEDEIDEGLDALEKEVTRPEKVGLSTAESKPFLEREVSSLDQEMHFSPPLGSRETNASPLRRSSRRKGNEAQTTGVNLLAHSDRKEFLGRIGCDKNS